MIALTYFTESLLLVDSFGQYLVLSRQNGEEQKEFETFTIPLQPNLSIMNYKIG